LISSLPAELAALYLCISTKQLGELRKSIPDSQARKGSRLRMIKLVDLRRSFGAVMTAIEVPDGIKCRFLNHARANVTDTYTQAEWNLLRDWMMKIEQSILVRAPNVYNSLKPADWPPIPAPEPHVCRPAKPRTGRPRKSSTEQADSQISFESRSARVGIHPARPPRDSVREGT